QVVELLPGRRDGLGDPARVEVPVDDAVELLDAPGQIGVRVGRGRGRGVLTVKPGRYRPWEGTQDQARQGDREGSGERPLHGSPHLGAKVGEGPPAGALVRNAGS